MARRVLIADDSRDSVDLLATLLGNSGWEITGTDSVAEAKALLDSEPFDLLILESWLPDGDGVDFCRELRSSRPELPILFLSGAAFPADITNATEAGCSAYLVKPCDVNQLTQLVEKLVGSGSAPQSRFQIS